MQLENMSLRELVELQHIHIAMLELELGRCRNHDVQTIAFRVLEHSRTPLGDHRTHIQQVWEHLDGSRWDKHWVINGTEGVGMTGISTTVLCP